MVMMFMVWHGDLKVYYCENGVESIRGYAYENLPQENQEKVVFEENSPWANLVNKEGESKNLTLADMRGEVSLTINKEDGISSLEELYHFTSLKTLTQNNVTISSLEGLGNCRDIQYLYLNNCEIDNYQDIKYLTKLSTLYVERSGKTEEQDKNAVDKMLEAMKETNYSNLANFGIFGVSQIGTRDYNVTDRAEGLQYYKY